MELSTLYYLSVFGLGYHIRASRYGDPCPGIDSDPLS